MSMNRIPFFLIISVFLFIHLRAIASNRRVILQDEGQSNVLYSSLVSKGYTTYVVKSDYSLGNQKLKLKEGTVFEFDGGSIHDGILELSTDCKLIGAVFLRRACRNVEVRISGQNVCLERVEIINESGIGLRSHTNCSRLSILDSTISSSCDNAVKLVADHIEGVTENVRFENCVFFFRRMGVEIQNHGNSSCRYNRLTISGCCFKMLPSPEYGYAISLSGNGRNANISSNTINGTVVGVEIVGFSDVKIRNNSFIDITVKAIVASNERIMSNITIAKNRIICPKARLQILNTCNLSIKNNDLRLMNLELGGCTQSIISDNNIYSYGHYAVMIDGTNKESRNNIVQNNTIEQLGDNWAVFRCYGKNATKNRFLRNKIKKAISKGVLYDQKNGAANNVLKK